jgi:uncharacterized membrane protein
MAVERTEQISGAVERNIQSIAAMEENREQSKSTVDRYASAVGTFAGSKLSIALHLTWFTLWLLVNTHRIPGVHPFDPYPFSLLSVCVSTEAVLLSTFVLFKQNRMQHRADHLEQLNLQIDLLTEKEVTKSLQLLRAICNKLEIAAPLGDSELAEMSQVTSVGSLAERILEDLPPPKV